MSLLDSTIVNVALRRLSLHFGVSLVTIQWVVTSYLLALAAVVPMTGWAARRVGVKRLYLGSVAAFTAASLLCGLSHTVGQLIALRVLQGAAGGVIASVGQMLLVMRADRGNLARVMSAVGVPMIIAPIAGPVVGGLLLDGPGWRWIFFVNVPVGVATVLLGRRYLAADTGRPGQPLDALGLVLAGAGMVGITYGLAEIGAGGQGAARVLLPLLAGVLLAAAFVVHALRAASPVLDLRLYRSSGFTSACLSTLCSGAAVYGGMILLPLYLQSVRGVSAAGTGLLLIPQGCGAAVGMYLSGRVTDRLGAGTTALIGGTAMTLSSVPLAFLTSSTSYWLIGSVTSIRGAGIGLLTMPAMTAAFRALSPHQVNDAAPQLNMLQRLGGSVGTTLFAVVLQRQLGQTASAGGQAAAYGATFWWVVGVTMAATVPTIMLRRNERNNQPKGAQEI
jgi:EmrB/QacA subfamily drug resistance transporter